MEQSAVVNTPIPEKPKVAWKWGFIAFAGKFEITNMADEQVDLTPEETGASFSEEEKGKLTVAQLKFCKCFANKF